jgi:hypothetical protein
MFALKSSYRAEAWSICFDTLPPKSLLSSTDGEERCFDRHKNLEPLRLVRKILPNKELGVS